MKAVVLLSGGLDSATTLAIARKEGFACHALTFRYGQRHGREIEAARRVARSLGAVEHRVIDVDLRALGGSALTDARIEVPKDRPDLGDSGEIPPTYVPARNTIFLSYALAWAEVMDAWDIFIGVNSTDYSGYPDCRPEYINAFETMANLATKRAISGCRLSIHAPLIHWTKAQIIRRGLDLGVDYSQTLSCYDPGAEGKPCERCDSCLLRMRGFAENGLTDPAVQS